MRICPSHSAPVAVPVPATAGIPCSRATIAACTTGLCPMSGSPGRTRLMGMHIAYVVVTALAAFMNCYAAFLNFSRAESIAVVADRVRVPRELMLPLGTALALGAVGLLAGFVVPAVGAAAAIGLTVYFTGALTAHLRVGDRRTAGAVFFLVLAVAALSTNVAYHATW